MKKCTHIVFTCMLDARGTVDKHFSFVIS